MQIGELSARTGVPNRMLRYYEQQALLRSERRGNGYREYEEDAVARVAHIRGLISSGLNTRLVQVVLNTMDDPELARTCSRSFADQLAVELERIEERISCLTRSRDTVRDFLSRTEAVATVAGREPAVSTGPTGR